MKNILGILTRGLLLLLAPMCATSTIQAQWSPREKKAIENGLAAMALREADLSFARLRVNAKSSPALTKNALENPISGSESVMELHAKSNSSISKMLQAMHNEFAVESGSVPQSVQATSIPANIALPPDLIKPVTELIQAISQANASIKAATSKLSLEEKQMLIDSLPQWAAAGTDIKSELGVRPKQNLYIISQVLAKINMPLIRESSIRLTTKIEENLPKLKRFASIGWRGNLEFNSNGVNVELSGIGDDIHESRQNGLCIDLGGHNRYTGRYASGKNTSSVLIDFGSETTTNFGDGCGGTGILGIGVAAFMGSRPDLNGKSFCFGTGIAGVGVTLVDQTTRVESRAFGQGFGIAGCGLFVGSKGSDNLKIGYMGQGAAVMSGFGWNYNPGGNDRYRAGGLVADGTSISNNPLAPANAFLARSQGYSGLIAGGIGLLTDASGDDVYDGGNESQACATTQGIGSLLDEAGRDTYLADRKSQSFSTSEGFAALFELAGDDVYAIRKNESQAFASERSVALFLDRQGDDLIASNDAQPGYAQEGSVALFLDADGSNRITGLPGDSALLGGRLGVGLFLSLGNNQKIPEGEPSGSIAFRSPLGLATFEEIPAKDEDLKPIVPGSLLKEPEEIDTLWEQVNLSGNKAAISARYLSAIGMPAFERFVQYHAANSSQRARRVAANLLTLAPEAKSMAVDLYPSSTTFTKAALLDIAAIAKIKELQPMVEGAFEAPSTRREALRYATATQMTEPSTIRAISGLLLGSDPLTSQEATIALEKLGDASMLISMQSLLASSDIIIRQTAIRFIARFPEGLVLAKSLLAKSDDKSQLNAIEILGAIASEESVRLAGSGLNSSHQVVRIKTLNILSQRLPDSYRARVQELTKDNNPIVSGLAKGILNQ